MSGELAAIPPRKYSRAVSMEAGGTSAEAATALEKRKNALEAALMRNDCQTCQFILQEVDVNVPIGKKQEPALIMAVKKSNVKMVRFLSKYKNSNQTKTMALELALGCRACYNLEVIKPLIHAGAYTISPVCLGRFFKEHSKDTLKCRAFLDIICDHAQSVGWKNLRIHSPMYKLLGALLRMAMVIPYRIDLGLQPDHRYMPGWTTYELVYFLLLNGANAENHWDPLFHDKFNRMRYRDTVLPLDHSIFCLYVRTAAGRSLPYKVEALLASYISVRIKFTDCHLSIYGLIENMLKVLLWCGVVLKEMKLYEMAKNRSIANPHTNTRLITTYKNIKCIFDRVQRYQLLSLQQICRLCVQHNVNGPNLLYSLNTISLLPKSMKDMLVLENVLEVQDLENPDGIKEGIHVHMALS